MTLLQLRERFLYLHRPALGLLQPVHHEGLLLGMILRGELSQAGLTEEPVGPALFDKSFEGGAEETVELAKYLQTSLTASTEVILMSIHCASKTSRKRRRTVLVSCSTVQILLHCEHV